MKNFLSLASCFLFVLVSCERTGPEDSAQSQIPVLESVSKQQMARILSSLPLGEEQFNEVYSAVSSSSGNGYDEEYTMACLFDAPGSGVGEDLVKSGPVQYKRPIRDLLREKLGGLYGTKTSSPELDALIEAIKKSGLQIYWPFSENWDGKTAPLVTFDPGYGAESNYAYELSFGQDGVSLGDSVLVDENMAMKRPVWVINSNEDSGFTPMDLYKKRVVRTSKSPSRMLLLKSVKLLRNYDSWFGGASELVFQIGNVNGFIASTEAELRLYYPQISHFTIMIKRSQKGVEVPLDAVIMTDFTSQMDKLAFLFTEDDGGTRTSWKCSAVVKIQSKSYGFEVDLPYNDKDDVIWRGQLSASYLQSEDEVSGRFGDAIITFELL